MNNDITKNIYRTALNIGYENLNEGISYNEMIKLLNDQGNGNNHNIIFYTWFFNEFRPKTFYIKTENHNLKYQDIVDKVNNGLNCDINKWDSSIELMKTKTFLKAEGVMRLMEFIELEDARNSAKSANLYARIAISFSIITALISIYFSITSKNDFIPLNTNTKNIEIQIKEIKNEVNSLKNNLKDEIKIFRQKQEK